MTSVLVNSPVKIIRKNSRTVRHSVSYLCALLLILYTVFYYYYELFNGNKDDGVNVIILLFTTVCDFALLIAILSKSKRIPIRLTLLSGIFIITSIISFFVTGSGFHRILVLSMILLASYLFLTQPLNKNEAKKIFWIFCIAAVIIFLNTSDIGKEAGKFNSNTGGFLASVIYCAALSLLITTERNKRWKYLLVAIIAFALQFKFGSRTALFGLLLFTLAVIVLRANKKTFSAKTVVLFIIFLACLGIGVAYVYAEVLPNVIGNKNVIIFGKNLFSGREGIWHYTFESVKSNLLFGVGGRLNEKYVIDNPIFGEAHNSSLGILAGNGVFVFVAFYSALAAVLASVYAKCNRIKKSFVNRLPAIFMAVIICMSFFDNYFTSLYNVLPIIIIMSVIASARGQYRRIRRVK